MSDNGSLLDHEIIVVPGYGETGRDVLKQQCIDLRIEVFIHEQGFCLDDEIDEFRDLIHLLTCLKGNEFLRSSFR